jgi:hypothetical protein
LKEFRVMVEAFEEKSKRDMELLAWMSANVMNCWTKKTLRPSDLLPKNFRKGQVRQESEYVKKRFAAVGGIESFKAQMREKKQREEEARDVDSEYEHKDDTAVIVLDREVDGLPDEGEVDDG